MRHFFLILLLFVSASCQPGLPTEPGFSVHTHPDGSLFVGDKVSFEVIPPAGWEPDEKQASLEVGEKELAIVDFSPFGVGQRKQATFWWTWDTENLPAGEHTVSFSILPDGKSWHETIELLPTEERPFAQASWVSTTTECCTLAYITGTAAERDIDILKKIVDELAVQANERLQSENKSNINITFMPRLLGHGGFVSNGIYVTYMDGNITGNITNQVILHEMVHSMDRSLGGKLLPAMLVEGLAVYLSGGHFKNEALLPRAGALLELDTYIPLDTLAKDFYNQQHETGYLEAGALVEYMVERYGWDAYQTFYRDIEAVGNQAESMEVGLIKHFHISLDQLEKDFLNELQKQDVAEEVKNDLRLTVEFYDSLRSYQQVLDPSAYFLTAWFPDGDRMRQAGITADFLRVPNRVDNRVFEFLLRTASSDLESDRPNQAEMVLKMVNFLLSLYPQSTD